MKDLWPVWYRPPGYHRRAANDLVASVAKDFGVLAPELRGRGNMKNYVDARSVVAVLLRARGWSYPQIGRLLDRDHSTVINLCRRFSQRYDKCSAVSESFTRHRTEDAQYERVRAS